MFCCLLLEFYVTDRGSDKVIVNLYVVWVNTRLWSKYCLL